MIKLKECPFCGGDAYDYSKDYSAAKTAACVNELCSIYGIEMSHAKWSRRVTPSDTPLETVSAALGF